MSGQEKRAQKNHCDDEEKQHQLVENFLDAVVSSPSMYSKPRLEYLRHFVSMVQRNPSTFVSVDQDNTVDMPLNVEEKATSTELSKGYIKAMAEHRSGSGVSDHPTLCVYAVDPKFYEDVAGRAKEKQQNVKLTNMRLVDGDGVQIHTRLAIHLTEMGRMLKRGDIIRLDLFTELRYRVNITSPRIPTLFILRLSRVGHMPLPDTSVKGILACSSILPNEDADQFKPSEDRVIDPRIHDKPTCTDANRICAVYSIRFIGCVCEVLPVAKRNLATIKQDCYFATDEIKHMTNSHKRNMLF